MTAPLHTIALFPTAEAAQAYCDARSTALGCPVVEKHPRTGKSRVVLVAWDVPRPHPSGDGRAWCTVDPDGDAPTGCDLVKELPPDWIPKPVDEDAPRKE